MGEPKDPVGKGPLTEGPFFIKVDRYGSVSGLIRVRVPLGMLVITTEVSEVSFSSEVLECL